MNTSRFAGFNIDSCRARLEQAAGGQYHGGVVTVRSLVKRFIAHARTRYSPRHGESSNEVSYCGLSFRPLLLLYGDRSIAGLGPVQWRAVQLWFIESGLCCRGVNARMARVRRMLRWAVGRALIKAETLSALEVVEPVRPPQAHQPDPVEAVPVDVIEATLPFMGPVVRVISRLQLLTAMRPGEVIVIEANSIDRSVEPWGYRPNHKTQWRGGTREIYLGPKAQSMLAPFMLRHPTGPIFRSRLGTGYSVNSYSQAVRKATIRAVAAGAIEKRWSVNQLRHTAAIVAAQESVTTAQHLLGHTDPKVTQTYLNGFSRALAYAATHG